MCLQAMVHELIGIQGNKVDLRNIGKVPKDQQVAYICISALLFLSLIFRLTIIDLIDNVQFPVAGCGAIFRARCLL